MDFLLGIIGVSDAEADRSAEGALTVRAKKRRKTFTDHLGNEYPTLKAMLEKYGVSSSAYCKRRRKGWTEKECLLGRKKKKSRPSKLQIMESKKRLKTTENKFFDFFFCKSQLYFSFPHSVRSDFP